MAEQAEPKPGRPRKELRGEIIDLLENTDKRAMTLGTITNNVDGARRTVKDRLDGLVGGPVESEKIGNATAYWIPNDHPSASLSPAVDQDQTPDGGYVTTWRDRILVSALAMLVGIGLVGSFGVIASLAGNTLPLPLSVWASAWGVGLLAAIAVTFALVWSVYDIAKLEKIRREKYADTHWLRSWVGNLKP